MSNAYIVDGVRTAIGNIGGGLSDVRPDDLAALAIAEVVRRNPNLDPSAVTDVVLGCANQAGEDNRNVARMALLLAGLPVSVPGETVNRLCASGHERRCERRARREAGRGRFLYRRRRREHDARAVRDVEGQQGVRARHRAVRHEPRLAVRESEDESEVRHRFDGADRRERRRAVRRVAVGSGRVRAQLAAEGGGSARCGAVRS